MNANDIAIKAEKISKCYRIGLKEDMHETFVKSIFHFVKSPLKNYRKYRSLYKFDDISHDSDSNSDPNASSLFWALKDVSIEIKRGETVGIIGKNGAGKSTVLKIFSRITRPTEGHVELRGRISSLLEVGTGFHSELTGRENVYLNGTILGMRKCELDKKFDKIVEFSGVEKFIDTPVKRYSSGMQVRLAFSVAAYLDPEILIVDEVLAVGDTDFQTKCINKMQDIRREDRTVIFVSHNMTAVTRLCDRAILIDNGRVIDDGPSGQIVARYLNTGLGTTLAREWNDPVKAPGNEIVRLCSARVRDVDGKVANVIDIRQPFTIEVEYEVLKSGHVLMANFGFDNEEGTIVFVTIDHDPAWRRRPRPLGRFVSTVHIPGNYLAEGTLIVGVGIITEKPYVLHCDEPHALIFQVVDSLDCDSSRGDYAGQIPGVVRPLLKWTNQNTQSDYKPVEEK